MTRRATSILRKRGKRRPRRNARILAALVVAGAAVALWLLWPYFAGLFGGAA